MTACIGIYIVLLVFWWRQRRGKRIRWLEKTEEKKLLKIIALTNTIALVFFLAASVNASEVGKILRNDYGGGEKVEQYEVTVEGELSDEPISVEIGERAYTSAEIKKVFDKILGQLDELILGDNESADRVERDLNLVDRVGDYPVAIHWELSNYKIFDTEGHIVAEEIPAEGILVDIKGYLRYEEEEAMYAAAVRVFPREKTGKEGVLAEIAEQVKKSEEQSRFEAMFHLPKTVDGKRILWKKPDDTRGYLILILGMVIGTLLIWNGRKEKKEKKQKMQEEMERDYPNIISAFVMLLATGMTVKQIWVKVVENYEKQREEQSARAAYEEMKKTCLEIQQGIPEAEAYERFGNRCGQVLYLKFGALLSQNLRKGSAGIGELLKVESIQAFEMRKSIAKKKGEEAGTKLMLPMMGMLGVVMVMVIVPAFLSMQI